MNPTDEQAAESAERAGGRFRTADCPKLWACEPAAWKTEKRADGKTWSSWRWLEAPQILFHSPAPTCDGCGKPIIWLGPPKRKLGMFVYEIQCWCPRYDERGQGANHSYDRIVSPFPLRMGGTAEWWEETHGITAP